MENNPLLQQIATMKQSFLDEGILDEQFNELEKLNSDDDPNFVEDTVNLFLEDTKQTLATVEEELMKTLIDSCAVDRLLHKIKGSSVSIGANKVRIEVERARNYTEPGNAAGLEAAFELVKLEIENLKAKLDAYFQLVKQAKDAK